MEELNKKRCIEISFDRFHFRKKVEEEKINKLDTMNEASYR